MKKTSIILLTATLFSNLFITPASASNIVDSSDATNTDFIIYALHKEVDYHTFENKLTNVTSIDITYQNKKSFATYDRNNGEVIVDGELVAIINREEVIYDQDFDIIDDMISINSSREFVIGTSSHGSGVYNYTYGDTGTISIISATMGVVSLAAVLVSLFTKSNVLKTYSAITGAASAILSAVGTKNTTVSFSYRHLKDKYKTGWFKDTLSLFKGTTMSTNTRICGITHYFGLINKK